MKNFAIDAYMSVEKSSLAEGGDALTIVRMLYNDLLESLKATINAMQEGDVVNKNKNLGYCVAVLHTLHISLDRVNGGVLSENLDMIYEWMRSKMLEALRGTDVTDLKAVESVATDLSDAWNKLKL